MEKKHLLFTVLSFVAVNTLKSAQGVVRNTTSGCEVTVDLTDGQTPAVKHTTLGGSPQIALVLNVDGVSNPEEIKLKTKELPWIMKEHDVRFRSVVLSSQEDVSWSINTTGRVSECKRDEVNIKTCTVPLVTTLGNSRLYFYVCLGLLTVSIIINIVLVCVFSLRRQTAQLALNKGALAATRDRAAVNNNVVLRTVPHQPSVPGVPATYSGNEFYSETETEENYYENILDMRY